MRGSMTETSQSQPTYAPERRVSGANLADTTSSLVRDEADQLLCDADAFLRLGLVRLAIGHLADAVRRDPSLRALREPLVKLYLSQRQYSGALAELWTLARTSRDPSEEERYLRHILHLDGRQRAAMQRLEQLLANQRSALTRPKDDSGPSLRAIKPHEQASSAGLAAASTGGYAQSGSSTQGKQPQPVPDAGRSPPSSLRTDATSLLKKGTILRSFGQLQPASLLFQQLVHDEACGIRATLLLGQCQRDLGRTDEAIETFLSGINRATASEDDLSEFFYELGRSYERLCNVKVATLYYHLAIGSTSCFRDAHERIAALRASKPKL